MGAQLSSFESGSPDDMIGGGGGELVGISDGDTGGGAQSGISGGDGGTHDGISICDTGTGCVETELV